MTRVLHDPLPEALESGRERVRSGLDKGAERGRWTAEEARAAGERLTLAASLEELSGCELVIEAAPERIELKRELFGRLSEICGDGDGAGHQHLVDPGQLAGLGRGDAPTTWWACTSSTRRR